MLEEYLFLSHTRWISYKLFFGFCLGFRSVFSAGNPGYPWRCPRGFCCWLVGFYLSFVYLRQCQVGLALTRSPMLVSNSQQSSCLSHWSASKESRGWHWQAVLGYSPQTWAVLTLVLGWKQDTFLVLSVVLTSREAESLRREVRIILSLKWASLPENYTGEREGDWKVPGGWASCMSQHPLCLSFCH